MTTGDRAGSEPAESVSEQRRAVQVANGRKGGPKTERGKRIAARNAVKSGIYANADAIPLGPLAEDPDELAALRAAFIAEQDPQTSEQQILAEAKFARHLAELRSNRAVESKLASLRAPITAEDVMRRDAARQRESDLLDAQALRRWLMRDRDPLWGPDEDRWKSVALREQRAQRFVALLQRYHVGPVTWPPKRWSTNVVRQSDQLWFLGLRDIVIDLFDGDSTNLRAWAEQVVRQLSAAVHLDDDAEQHAREMQAHQVANDQLHILDWQARIQSRARYPQAIAKLTELYDNSRHPGEDE